MNYQNIQYKPSTLNAIINAFNAKNLRNWNVLYFYFDIHQTILYPDYNNEEELKFYPYIKEILQHLSKQNDIVLGIYTCSYPDQIKKYFKFFEKNNINFKYVNKNPEAMNTKYGYYVDKPYFNVLFDDKCGLNAEIDWYFIAEYFGLINNSKNDYYVYVYLDPRKSGFYNSESFIFPNEPFYVGKGKNNRHFDHLKESELNKENGNIIKQRKIKKILSLNKTPIIYKIFDNVNENFAYHVENLLILDIGRVNNKTGVLTNLNDGGYGNKNCAITNKTKEKISKSLKNYHINNPISDETKQKIGDANRGRKYSKEYIKHLKEIRKGTKITHRKKYYLISPTNVKHSFIGKDRLIEFVKKENLSYIILMKKINSGKILNSDILRKTQQTLNSIGWEIIKSK